MTVRGRVVTLKSADFNTGISRSIELLKMRKKSYTFPIVHCLKMRIDSVLRGHIVLVMYAFIISTYDN